MTGLGVAEADADLDAVAAAVSLGAPEEVEPAASLAAAQQGAAGQNGFRSH